MFYKSFVIDGLKSSTIFVDIPHRSYAKTFHSLGLHPHQTSKSFPLHLYFIVSKIYPKLESKQIRLLNF